MGTPAGAQESGLGAEGGVISTGAPEGRPGGAVRSLGEAGLGGGRGMVGREASKPCGRCWRLGSSTTTRSPHFYNLVFRIRSAAAVNGQRPST